MSLSSPARIYPNDPLWSKAIALHKKAIVIDTHSDLPLRMLDEHVDISKRRNSGHQDIPRMLEHRFGSYWSMVGIPSST